MGPHGITVVPGFAYYDCDGRLVSDPVLRARFDHLVILPAVFEGCLSGALFIAMQAGRQSPTDARQAALSEQARGVLELLRAQSEQSPSAAEQG